MNKDVPKANRRLFDKWTKMNLQIHKKSLSTTRPVVKTAAPESLKAHPRFNKKREQTMLDMNMEIEKENNSLLRKINDYVRTKRNS